MDNGGKWLLVVLGAIMALVLLFAGAVPLFQATIEHTQQSTIEDMMAYWLEQGYVAYADPDGTLHVYDIEPNDTCTYDLGSLSKYFRNIYINGELVTSGTVSGDLIPTDNDTYDLGSDSNRWKDLYIVDGSIHLGDRVLSDDGTQLKVDDTFIGAPGTPDYVVGVNTATDDVPETTGYWVKSGSTGEVVRSTADGNADDDINYAIGLLSNGGILQLTAGNFLISSNVTWNKVGIFRGAGNWATILQPSANSVTIIRASGTGRNKLSDFHIWGDNTTYTGVIGMDVTSYGGYIENIEVSNCDSYGIFSSYNPYMIWWNVVKVVGCNADGIHLGDPSGAWAQMMVNVDSEGNNGDGIYILGGENYLCNITADNNCEVGIYLYGGSGWCLTNFWAGANDWEGLYLRTIGQSDISNGIIYYNLLNRDPFNTSQGQIRLSMDTDNQTYNLTNLVIDWASGPFNSSGIDGSYTNVANMALNISNSYIHVSNVAFLGVQFVTARISNSNIIAGSLGANVLAYHNTGFVTENSGTATITDNTTSITVTHGLATTPTRVQVTPTTSLGAATKFWVDTKGATTFVIHVDADPDANITFDWRAVVGEGN